MDSFLGEIANAMVFWLGDFAGILLENATDALHESGLACAIVPGKGNALLFADGKSEILKDHAGSEFHAEVFYSEHAGGLVETGRF